MAIVTHLTDAVTREPYYRTVDGRQWRRLVGAVTWPYDKARRPGCVIILGELRASPTVLGAERHDVYCLDEYLHDDVTEIVRMVSDMTDDWRIPSWATPLRDERHYLLDDANDNRRIMRLPKIRYADPPGYMGKGEGQIPYFFSLIQRRTRSEKSLYLGSDRMCASETLALDESRDSNATVTAFPAFAALAFALAEIDLHPLREWGMRSNIHGGPANLVGGY